MIAPNLTLTPDTQVVFQGIPYDDLPGFPRQVGVLSQSNVAPFGIVIPYRMRSCARCNNLLSREAKILLGSIRLLDD